MNDQIKIVFIANAGFLIEFQGTKLLIDGIYDDEGHSFSCIPAIYWEEMKKGKGVLADVDYLLFTHEHADHFSPEKVMEYLEYQTPKAIFMPKRGSSALNELSVKAEQKGIPSALLEKTFCDRSIFMPEKGIRIKVLTTKHLDKRYLNVPHFCYFLQLGEKKILVTSDIDFRSEEMKEISGISLDAVFINPLMNHSKEGKEFLEKNIHTEKKIVYHIPFEGEDSTQIRSIAQKDISFQRTAGNIFFMETGQEVYL